MKGSPKSNLYVCGEDDTKMAVYNLEEGIEKGDRNSETIDFWKKTIEKEKNIIGSENKIR